MLPTESPVFYRVFEFVAYCLDKINTERLRNFLTCAHFLFTTNVIFHAHFQVQGYRISFFLCVSQNFLNVMELRALSCTFYCAGILQSSSIYKFTSDNVCSHSGLLHDRAQASTIQLYQRAHYSYIRTINIIIVQHRIIGCGLIASRQWV